MHRFIAGIGSMLIGLGIAWTGPTRASAAPVEPDWSSTAQIDPAGRPNPYGWPEGVFEEKVRKGRLHALQYPLEITGLLVPERQSLRVLDSKPGDPLFGLMRSALSLGSEFKDFKGFWKWLGLHDYPEQEGEIPFPKGIRPALPMGVSLVERGSIRGVTLSCAACHSAKLFGRPILGLTNRFPRANSFFIHGKQATRWIKPGLFASMTGANREEIKMYTETRERIASVGLKMPETLGLDTSLAQVALSLARRAESPWAERDPVISARPRPNPLEKEVADSKPAPWWTVKYKTRWLSDGSVISGNPIFTNFLWNEIGRGADLPELVLWMEQNRGIIEDLTTAVFATRAPEWKEFLSAYPIDLERARRGERLYRESCAGCHGQYEKSWNAPDSGTTIGVRYPTRTRIKDVGTDPGRRLGMKELARALNPLRFSQQYDIVIEEQAGYVPPPLDGIFARFPYFHNNSIPNLCALMTPPAHRPKTYYSGEVEDPSKHFDPDCVGYPVGPKTPPEWRTAKDSAEHLFDTGRPGLSNDGHYRKIFTREDGSEKFTPIQKRDLIEFLKTL